IAIWKQDTNDIHPSGVAKIQRSLSKLHVVVRNLLEKVFLTARQFSEPEKVSFARFVITAPGSIAAAGKNKPDDGTRPVPALTAAGVIRARDLERFFENLHPIHSCNLLVRFNNPLISGLEPGGDSIAGTSGLLHSVPCFA